MPTWIFQCNPDSFDIDGYLSRAPERITWSVNQSWKQIQLGDQVFLWRSQGKRKALEPGIVAECRVDSAVADIEGEPESKEFYIDGPVSGTKRSVWLHVVRIADAGNILSRSMLAQSPVLSRLGPIAFGNATNFSVKEDEVGMLNLLWQTRVPPSTHEESRENLERATRVLEEKSVEDLLGDYAARSKSRGSGTSPSRTQVTSSVFERDPYVRAIALVRANRKCEIPGCRTEEFETDTGGRYCEVHHIQPLSEGGPDTPENAACVCASHHRELHVGTRRDELADMLRKARERDRSRPFSDDGRDERSKQVRL